MSALPPKADITDRRRHATALVPLKMFQRRLGVADFVVGGCRSGRSLALLARGGMQSCNLGPLFLDRGNEIRAGADTHH